MKNKVSVLRGLEYVMGGMNALMAVWSGDNKIMSIIEEWNDILYEIKEDVENENAEDA